MEKRHKIILLASLILLSIVIIIFSVCFSRSNKIDTSKVNESPQNKENYKTKFNESTKCKKTIKRARILIFIISFNFRNYL